MPIMGVVQQPVREPWSWTVAELGQHLTTSQRETLLARFRRLGYPVGAWGSVGAPWTWSVAYLGAQLTAAQRDMLLARFRALGYKDTTEWVVGP